MIEQLLDGTSAFEFSDQHTRSSQVPVVFPPDSSDHDLHLGWSEPNEEPEPEPPQRGTDQSDLLRKVFCTLFPPISETGDPRAWVAESQRKLLALAWQLGIPGIGEHSLAVLGKRIGCQRATLSFWACRLEDTFGLKARSQRTEAARRAYSERASRVWAEKDRYAASRKAKEEADDHEMASDLYDLEARDRERQEEEKSLHCSTLGEVDTSASF